MKTKKAEFRRAEDERKTGENMEGTYHEFSVRRQQSGAVRLDLSVLLAQTELHGEPVQLGGHTDTVTPGCRSAGEPIQNSKATRLTVDSFSMSSSDAPREARPMF